MRTLLTVGLIYGMYTAAALVIAGMVPQALVPLGVAVSCGLIAWWGCLNGGQEASN